MFKLQIKKKGFTLAEVLIVCTVFAVMVVGMILAINRAFVFMDNIKLQVIATNLAREGVEMMYNRRDTNWRKYSGERDKMWLYTSSVGINSNKLYISNNGGFYLVGNPPQGKEELPWMYVSLCSDEILESIYGDANEFFRELDNKSSSCYGFIRYAKIGIFGRYPFYSGGVIKKGGDISYLFDQTGEFYRLLRVYGIYNKETGDIITQNDLQDGAPAEMRFCVKVFYRANGNPHSSELCSIMTNFMK